MDRRSLIVAGVLGVALLAAIGVGIGLTTGGGGNSAVKTPTTSSTTIAPPVASSTTTSSTPIVSPSTVNVPKPSVVITPTTGPTTPTTTPTGQPGITNTTIRVGVIADSAAVAHGVEAWAYTLNQAGGLAGRTVKVDAHVVTSPAVYAAAVANVCTTDFAVVGSSSQFDGQTGGFACGIPDLATLLFTSAHQALPNSFAVLPERAGVVSVGAFKQLLSTVSGCCRQFVLVPTVDPGRGIVAASARGAAAAGFTTAGTPEVPAGAGPAEYKKLVAALVAEKATFARSGLGAASTVALRKAAAADPASSVVQAWYCAQECADPPFLAEGGAAVEGQYVDVPANPLSDQAAVPAIATYVQAAQHFGGPTVAGLESNAAGLLFEQVVKQVVATSGVNGITRSRVVAAVTTVHSFTAGGILGTTDVGGRQPTGCFALLQVKNGQLTRVFPTTAGELNCGSQNLQNVPKGA
ncbi:MAG TPA: hypothetical protein VN180_03225 [Acidimicrobiia bacterium]|nr:hypothetical protein [Acidimicrobiia bacterium]